MPTKYHYLPAFATFAGLAALAILPARAQSSLGEARILRSERATRPAPRNEPRDIQPPPRNETPGTPVELVPFSTTGEKPAKPEWKIESQVSLAYTDFQAGGHGWNVPFEVTAQYGDHKFILQTDGFADLSPPQNKDGFNDILLQYRRPLWTETTAAADDPKQSLNLTVGGTIPVGGDIGSKQTKERCTLGFNSPLSPQTSLAFTGGVRRSEAAKKAGKNPYTQVVSAMITHDLNKDKDRSLFAQIVSAHPNTASWSSVLVAGYGFTINKKSVTLSVSRGLNAPEKDTAIQIDWGW